MSSSHHCLKGETKNNPDRKLRAKAEVVTILYKCKQYKLSKFFSVNHIWFEATPKIHIDI